MHTGGTWWKGSMLWKSRSFKAVSYAKMPDLPI